MREAVSLVADVNETKGQWNPIGLTYKYSKASQISFKSHMRGFHPRFRSYQQGWTVFGVNLGSLTIYLASHVEMLPSGSVYKDCGIQTEGTEYKTEPRVPVGVACYTPSRLFSLCFLQLPLPGCRRLA